MQLRRTPAVPAAVDDDPGEGAVDVLAGPLGLRDAWATGSGTRR